MSQLFVAERVSLSVVFDEKKVVVSRKDTVFGTLTDHVAKYLTHSPISSELVRRWNWFVRVDESLCFRQLRSESLDERFAALPVAFDLDREENRLHHLYRRILFDPFTIFYDSLRL